MNAKTIGLTIASLRRQRGMTQAQLAELLRVSDKTVSKWENGMGFPEVTQFPIIARVFGVSIDYLMTGSRNGIAVAGNIVTDLVKTIDRYPACGMLSTITEVSQAVGGCVPNVGIDLAKIDRTLPLFAVGRVGDDEYGRFVLSRLQAAGMNVDQITVTPGVPTGFSDVMSLRSGERTFFLNRGTNAVFAPEDINLATLSCRILHIGYILLLDQFDKPDPDYGTVMARFLHEVQQCGIKTSIDVVSESSGNYQPIVPALAYCNYAILNEIESCGIWHLEPYAPDGTLRVDVVRDAMERMADAGVSEKVIVHAKKAGFCLDVPTWTFTQAPSLGIPHEWIKGTVGAGDAFCAGCLYGLYHGYDDRMMLEFAAASAAASLTEENSVDGMKPKEELLELMQKYGRKIV